MQTLCSAATGGSRCICLGDYASSSSSSSSASVSSGGMHQSHRVVVCVVDRAEICELDAFMRTAPVLSTAAAELLSPEAAAACVASARRGLEREIERESCLERLERMREWLCVAVAFEDAQRLLRQKTFRIARARRTIESHCVRSLCDPAYRLCRSRLLREHAGCVAAAD